MGLLRIRVELQRRPDVFAARPPGAGTSIPRLRELDLKYGGRVNCVFSNRASIEKYALEADLVIGAVLTLLAWRWTRRPEDELPLLE